jgi:hypothetical protein
VDTVHRVSLLTDTLTLVVFIHRTLYLDWSLSLLLVYFTSLVDNYLVTEDH